MNRKAHIFLILVLLITLGLLSSNKPTANAQVATLTPPDLTITKTHSGQFKVGFGGNYQLTITNKSTAVATDQTITVTDTLPAGMTISATPAIVAPNFTCGTVGTQTLTCTSTTGLGSGISTTINFSVDILKQAVGTANNTAQVNTPDEFNQSDNTSPVDTVVVQGSPDLVLFKTHSDPMTINANNDFTIKVQNIGTAATTQQITVTDTLNAALTPISAGDLSGSGFWSCSVVAQVVTCVSTVGSSLAAFGTTTDSNSIRLTVKPNTAGVFSNTTAVTESEEPTNATGNNSSTDNPVTVVAPPDMQLVSKTLTAAAPIPANTLVVNELGQKFTIQVKNIGAQTLFGKPIIVTDTLPNGITFDTGSTSGGNNFGCTAAGQVVTCTRNTQMALNEVANIDIPVKVAQAALGAQQNNATVTTQGDAQPGNNTLPSPVLFVVDYLDLKLTKTHSPASLLVGQPVTFSFQVDNIATGPNAIATLGNITLTDTLPAGLTYAATVTGANWTCGAAAQVVTCTYNNGGGAINAGASSTVTFNATVGTTTAASITNQGVISTRADLPADPSGPNNTATDGPITVQKPDLIISKVPIGTFSVGQPGDYQIIVTNQGTGATSTQISITDTLEAGFTTTVTVVPNPSNPPWSCGPFAANAITCTNPGPVPANGGSLPTLTLRTTPLVQGTHQNTVTVTNTEDTNTGNNSATAQVTVNPPPPPVLSIAKTHVGANFVVNQTGVYHIDIQNVGQGATVANPPIVVTDILPSSFNFVSAAGTNWTCTPAAAQAAPPAVQVQCTWTGGIVAGGANVALNQITVQVTPTTTLNSPFSNTATVTGGGSVTNSSTDVVTVTAAPGADLTITKTHATNFTTTPATPGTYTITIANAGTINSAGNITVTDTLPAGFTYVSGSGTGWACPVAPQANPIICTYTGAAITPAAGGNPSTVLSIVAQAGTAGNSFVNTATVSGGGDVNNLNNTANDPTTVTATNLPDTKITKTHVGNFTAGQQGQYTVVVTNVGNGATPGGYTTTVTDTLPGGLTFVAAGSGGIGWTCTANAATPQVVTCTNPTPMAAGASQNDLIITVLVPASAPSSVTNTVSVNAPTGDPNTTNNTTTDPTTVLGIVDISILKSHSGNFQVNVPSSYSITIQNVGGATSNGVITVTDTLPTFIVPTGASGTNWACAIVTQTVTCTRSAAFPIGGGGNSVITINVTADQLVLGGNATANVTNIANVSGGGDTNGTNNQASDPTTISSGPVADLSITKAHNGTFVTGQNGTYTLTVKNVGTGTANSPIVASDLLPNGLTFVAAGSSPLCQASGQQVTCTSLNSLAPNGQIPFTVQVAITAAANTTITNTANVTPPSGDPTSSNDTSTDQVTIATAPPVSQGNSTITAFPSTVPSDGITQATVTVTLRDTSGGVVANRQVTLSSTSGGVPPTVTVVGGTTGTTNTSGVVTFQVVSSTPQTVNFTALIGAPENFTISNSTAGSTVNFVSPNGLSPTLSTASANPTSIPADNVSTSTISGTIRNNLGVGIDGVSVTLTGSPNSGVTVSPGTTVTTSGGGNYSFTVRSSVVQNTTFQISATNGVSSITLSTQPTVNFTGTSGATATASGVVDVTKSTVTCNFISIPADNITTATVTASVKNSSSGGVSGQSVTLTANPALSGLSIQTSPTTSDSNGNASFTIRSVAQGGPVTFTASAGGLTITQTCAMSFTAPGTAAVVNPNATPGTGTPGTAGPGTGTANGVSLLAPPTNGPNIGIVLAFRLRVRTGPSLRYPVIGLLKLRTRVILVARVPRGTWFMIQLENGQTGWVSSGYIRVARLAFRHLPIIDPKTLPPPGAVPAIPIATPTPTKKPGG